MHRSDENWLAGGCPLSDAFVLVRLPSSLGRSFQAKGEARRGAAYGRWWPWQHPNVGWTTRGQVLGVLLIVAGLFAFHNADYSSRDKFERVASDVGATCDECPWYEFTDSLIWGVAGPVLTFFGLSILLVSFLAARDLRRAR